MSHLANINNSDTNHRHQALKGLKHRAVRDLAWALLQPRLFNALPDTNNDYLEANWLDKGIIEWLLELDHQPEALLLHLKDQRATRLGIYFEQLLSFYFSSYSRFTLISKNLQVNNSQRTIGEYDFIIFDHGNQQHYHIEVAIKFYLGYLDSDIPIKNNQAIYNWHQWLGPNKKDSLGIKMRHLLHHQLKLSETHEGQEVLKTIGVDHTLLKVKLLLTGRLYYPFIEDRDNLELITSDNIKKEKSRPTYSEKPENPVPLWISKEHFMLQHELFITTEHRYIILPRQLWMSELIEEDISYFSLNVISGENIREHIEEHLNNTQDHLHIAQLYPLSESRQEKSAEVRRFFIVN